MGAAVDFIRHLPIAPRVVAIALLAIAAHLLVLAIRRISTWLIKPAGTSTVAAMRRHPKFVTVTTIVVSAATFAIYFSAIGFILSEAGVSLTAYLASASVVGLAVGFGSQGLVQDVVIGLTLIFSDVLDVGDVVDIGGQTGRVERVGLRFTVITNILEQQVFVPNRNITQISRYRKGHIRAFVDVQIPDGATSEETKEVVSSIARAYRDQHSAVILAPPEVIGVMTADSDGWQYVRLRFRMWPGQAALLEQGFQQRVVAALKKGHPEYADWMVSVSFRVEQKTQIRQRGGERTATDRPRRK